MSEKDKNQKNSEEEKIKIIEVTIEDLLEGEIELETGKEIQLIVNTGEYIFSI